MVSVRKPPTFLASSKLIDQVGDLSRTRTPHVMEYDQKTSFIVVVDQEMMIDLVMTNFNDLSKSKSFCRNWVETFAS